MDLNQRFLAVMAHFGLNKGDFAQKVNISPGVISHISSGRNKPGLELVIALLSEFPTISSDWLLFGKGEMLRPKEHIGSKPEILKLINEVKLLNEMNYSGLNMRIENLLNRVEKG